MTVYLVAILLTAIISSVGSGRRSYTITENDRKIYYWSNLYTIAILIVVGMPWLLKNLFSTIFEKQMLGQYLIPLGKYIGATGAVVVVSICICTLLRPSGIAAIVVNALISGGITLIVFYLLFRKSEEFKRAIGIIDRVTRGKFKLNKRIK